MAADTNFGRQEHRCHPPLDRLHENALVRHKATTPLSMWRARASNHQDHVRQPITALYAYLRPLLREVGYFTVMVHASLDQSIRQAPRNLGGPARSR